MTAKKATYKSAPRRMSREELDARLSALLERSSNRKESKLDVERREILHELEVSQIELEMQNRELRESRRAVDESHDRYIDLYDFAPVGYVTLDSRGIIREINLSAADLLGSERKHLVGRSFALKIQELDRPAFREHLMNCRHSGTKLSVEVVILSRTKMQTPVQLVSSEMRDRVTGERLFRTVMTDLTEQRRAKAELTKEKMRAEAASDTKSAFLANMSHEIRTPLASILGFTDLMINSKSWEERNHYGQIISRNGRALTRLIDDILDLTKVEAGRLQLEAVNFNLQVLVREIVLLFQNPDQKKDLKFHVEMDPSTPEMVNSDPTRIRQILVNLIGNAVKFTPSGSISVRVEPEFRNDVVTRVRFLVTDTGVGLSTDQVAILFEPFSQADSSTTRKFGGSGLGLTLSRRLARALGGDVTAQDFAPGKGCTFVASVEARPVKERVEDANLPASRAERKNKSKQPARILLVEDSADNQEYIQLVLQLAGMVVDVANNGAEGVRMAKTHNYDLVLMDMQMPVLDGYKATEELRLDGYDKPIIALTAHAMAEDRRRSLEIGCDAHLTKPLDTKLLVETINRLQR